jgi:hypothetical protein
MSFDELIFHYIIDLIVRYHTDLYALSANNK